MTSSSDFPACAWLLHARIEGELDVALSRPRYARHAKMAGPRSGRMRAYQRRTVVGDALIADA